MKKRIDPKRNRSTIVVMEETEVPALLLEPDLGEKVEKMRKEFGNLSRFLASQQSLPDEPEFVSGFVTIARIKGVSRRPRSHVVRSVPTTTKSR